MKLNSAAPLNAAVIAAVPPAATCTGRACQTHHDAQTVLAVNTRDRNDIAIDIARGRSERGEAPQPGGQTGKVHSLPDITLPTMGPLALISAAKDAN